MEDGYPSPYTRERACRLIERSQKDELDATFGIEIEGEVQGVGSVLFVRKRFRMRYDLGYWLSESQWGKGIMTEVVKSLVRYSAEDLEVHRVHAEVFDQNVASRRVLEKAGFQLDGKIRNAVVKNGQRVDLWAYSCGLVPEGEEILFTDLLLLSRIVFPEEETKPYLDNGLTQ